MCYKDPDQIISFHSLPEGNFKNSDLRAIQFIFYGLNNCYSKMQSTLFKSNNKNTIRELLVWSPNFGQVAFLTTNTTIILISQ